MKLINKNNRRELGIGIGLGIVISMLLLLVVNDLYPTKIVNKNEVHPTTTLYFKDSTISQKKIDSLSFYVSSHFQTLDSIYQISTDYEVVQAEKINSINGRFNDLYVALGIIVSLLMVIVGVQSLRSKAEINNIMRENFDEYEKDLISHREEAERLVGAIEGEYEFARLANADKQSIPDK